MISQRQLFLSHVAQTSDAPLLLEIDRAEGVYLFAQDGKRYIDLISGIGVSNVGHRHPKVVEAIKKQVDKYLHLMVYGELIQSPQVKLAQALSNTLPPSLNNTYFVNSGSEAIEGAMKLAKRFNQRREIISFYNAYHGSTQGALSINGSEKIKIAFRPLLPDIRHLRFNVTEDLSHITPSTSAVIIEPIQGEAGIRIPDKKFLQALAKRCKETHTLLILDEIQSGFGRTGKFWAFEHFDIVPDILVCAKGMGGGMPIGAFISSKEIMTVLTHNPVLGHITTFGGHPVSCAASMATLDIINSPSFLHDIGKKEQLFHQLLKHPKIKELRGQGLFMALQLDSYSEVKKVIDKCLEKGLLIDWFLYCSDALRLAPPLIIDEAQIKDACEILINALND
jgi:acetylornithine/succinyldiaminopimelate/putrescine aminotransferase